MKASVGATRERRIRMRIHEVSTALKRAIFL